MAAAQIEGLRVLTQAHHVHAPPAFKLAGRETVGPYTVRPRGVSLSSFSWKVPDHRTQCVVG
ncbi:rCG41884 [Rattus norvegicus]|uniref:RCG41884 n=1 Tax=Rattus norvegicus TaxID=10116 RepID=A6KKS2_RAT|nr:rCG41884 [Rattus norvegicus]